MQRAYYKIYRNIIIYHCIIEIQFIMYKCWYSVDIANKVQIDYIISFYICESSISSLIPLNPRTLRATLRVFMKTFNSSKFALI